MKSLDIPLNINKKEKNMLLNTQCKKLYVIFASSIFRCQQIGVIGNIQDLSENKVKVDIVDSLKETNFLEILQKEVKYLDIDRRYNHEDTIYFILRFKNEFSKNIETLKKLIK